MPPATNSPVAGSIGICPEAKIKLPTRTACEYGPMARGAESVAIISFTGNSGSVSTAKTNLYFNRKMLKMGNSNEAGSVLVWGDEVSTGSGPGSPRGQPAWGGGSDRVQVQSGTEPVVRCRAVANSESQSGR